MLNETGNQLQNVLFTHTDCTTLLEGLHALESGLYKKDTSVESAVAANLPHRFLQTVEPLIASSSVEACMKSIETLREIVRSLPSVHVVLCYEPTKKQLTELVTVLRDKLQKPVILRYDVQENRVGTQLEIDGKRYARYLHRQT